MNNLLIALLFSAGLAAWVYAKMSRRTGAGNTQNVLILTALAFGVAFVVLLTLLTLVFDL